MPGGRECDRAGGAGVGRSEGGRLKEAGTQGREVNSGEPLTVSEPESDVMRVSILHAHTYMYTYVHTRAYTHVHTRTAWEGLEKGLVLQRAGSGEGSKALRTTPDRGPAAL